MNQNENKNAVNYVINKIHSLLGRVEITSSQTGSLNYHFLIPAHDVDIIFGRDTMDDFEIAIEKYRTSDQHRGLESFINFRIYITLGQAGLIPKFLVSNEVLKEKRDWLQSYNVKFEKATWLYEIFYAGLKKLSSFLSSLVVQYKISSEDIKQEQEDINTLIDFYDKNRHFTDRGLSVGSLGYFKAAVLCVIDRKSVV